MDNLLTTLPYAILAQESAQAPKGSMLITFLPFIIIIAIFYFLLIRPDKKRRVQRQAMIDALEKNDHVITIGGIHGVVKSLTADEVVLSVDDSSNTRIKFSRSAISSVQKKDSSAE